MITILSILRLFLRAPFWNKLNLINFAWTRLKTRLIYRFAFGSMGPGTTIWRPIMLQNTQYVHLGRKVIIRDGARFDVVTDRFGRTFTPEVTIGDECLFEQGFHLAAAHKIVIGSHVTCSRNVAIMDVWHGYEDVTRAIIDQPLGTAPVFIGDGTLIGMGSVILPGVSIGRQCIIGANSVVNRDIPDYCVAAGAPARLLKRYNAERAQWINVSDNTEQK